MKQCEHCGKKANVVGVRMDNLQPMVCSACYQKWLDARDEAVKAAFTKFFGKKNAKV